ncbi:MAG: hypothetical protein M0Q00_00285 [Acholeplasmataceae bacterium]|nr:hypothetical protein [Acholeplasmataceae bacterium]
MKKFKKLPEQKLHLIDNKNLIDEDIIDRILYERPYASLINPYKKFFTHQLMVMYMFMMTKSQ